MGEPERTDVIVIGMGPGGEYAADALARAGLHVTAIEDPPVGGECPHFGCAPFNWTSREVVQAEQAPLRNMPYAYPTFCRAIADALRSLEGSS